MVTRQNAGPESKVQALNALCHQSSLILSYAITSHDPQLPIQAYGPQHFLRFSLPSFLIQFYLKEASFSQISLIGEDTGNTREHLWDILSLFTFDFSRAVNQTPESFRKDCGSKEEKSLKKIQRVGIHFIVTPGLSWGNQMKMFKTLWFCEYQY